MSEKNDLNKEELEKVVGGEYGRQWNISQFRQDYLKEGAQATTITINSGNTQFKPEDVGANSDLVNINKD